MIIEPNPDLADLQRHIELHKELELKLKWFLMPQALREPWTGRDFFPALEQEHKQYFVKDKPNGGNKRRRDKSRSNK